MLEVPCVYRGSLPLGNNLATLPGRNANQKFKWQFLVLLEEESVDFERELRVSGSTLHVEMVKAGERATKVRYQQR